MKKMLSILAGCALLASLSSAYAGQTSCPSPEDIRADGSAFTYAMFVDGWDWALISKPFYFDNKEWQTTFKIALPNVMSPNDAIESGSPQFKNTPLAMNPDNAVFGNKTICTYTAMTGGVMVTVSTPVMYGIRKG